MADDRDQRGGAGGGLGAGVFGLDDIAGSGMAVPYGTARLAQPLGEQLQEQPGGGVEERLVVAGRLLFDQPAQIGEIAVPVALVMAPRRDTGQGVAVGGGFGCGHVLPRCHASCVCRSIDPPSDVSAGECVNIQAAHDGFDHEASRP
ncbi:hypothetical protein [Streptomyces scopuliridis]|uniref:hypothetical protein n=1 Tax=Streptomyces scopuliridis TaxID=452529 RepID=UPI001F0C701D|nr:hypothetical protein [Streptomyces scopuliridis]